MRKIILLPIIIGAVAVTAGGVLFGLAVARNNTDNKTEEHTYNLEGDIKNFDINLNITDLKFSVSDDGTKKVTFVEREKEYHSAEVKDETLYIRFTDARRWHEKIFNFNLKPLSATVYLPVVDYTNLVIKSSTGDVDIPSEFTFENADIKLSTGDVRIASKINNNTKVEVSTGNVTFANLNSNEVNIKSSTGRITLNSATIADKITLKTDTGRIILNNVTAKEYESNSSTGDVTLTNTVIENKIYIKTSTGDVELNDSDADTLEIKTSTGDVNGTLLTAKIFDVHSHTGRINVPLSGMGGICKIDTDTGDIRITIKA